MLPVNFGIELEMVGPSTTYDNLMSRLREVIPTIKSVDETNYSYESWQLGYDASAANGYVRGRTGRFHHPRGLELRSPLLNDQRRKEGIQDLSRLLKVLRRRCCITKYCGMHVHMSCPERAEINGVQFARMLHRSYAKDIWRERASFCCLRCSEVKYSSVHRFDDGWSPDGGNHVEVRLFNGTLCLEEIEKRLDDSINLYRRWLRHGEMDGLGRKMRTKKLKKKPSLV